MHPERIEFAQGHEDESALMQPRMRHREVGLVDDQLAVEEDVQIDGSGPRSIIFIPSKRALNLTEDHQEATRSNIGFNLDDPVEKPVVSWLGMVMERFRFIEERHTHDLRVREQTQQRHGSIAEIDPIADVRPEADEDRFTHIRDV